MSRAFWGSYYSSEMEKSERKLHRRSIRDASNPFEFPDAEFQHLFRMGKNCVLYSCEDLKEALTTKCCRWTTSAHKSQDHGCCSNNSQQITDPNYWSYCQYTNAKVHIIPGNRLPGKLWLEARSEAWFA
ncbi:jg1141 [Pararge aegeria aegeria]|uniref:Jg1141 protein n=1 Tax=Pararge aegeria aegeria TaxID=348720 RepID=A0A8S4R1A4_9NEOP|nr:jg1141 [Pararge aegeria aegeria]